MKVSPRICPTKNRDSCLKKGISRCAKLFFRLCAFFKLNLESTYGQSALVPRSSTYRIFPGIGFCQPTPLSMVVDETAKEHSGMTSFKLHAGNQFPTLMVRRLDGTLVDIRQIESNADWKMIVVYRGRHCPLCTKFLNQLETFQNDLKQIGIDIVAVSGDSRDQLTQHLEKLTVSFPILFGLSVPQMQELGVYISHPRTETETDHLFSEPGLFVINENKVVQVVDISNNPFSRPHLESLVSGLKYIRENNYPIRGTYL